MSFQRNVNNLLNQYFLDEQLFSVFTQCQNVINFIRDQKGQMLNFLLISGCRLDINLAITIKLYKEFNFISIRIF